MAEDYLYSSTPLLPRDCILCCRAIASRGAHLMILYRCLVIASQKQQCCKPASQAFSK